MAPRSLPVVPLEQVVRLWLHQQGLSEPRGSAPFDRAALVDHLERTGALQLDSVNAVERAHYLTLWSRFGPYTRGHVDRWVYRERAATRPPSCPFPTCPSAVVACGDSLRPG